MAILGFGKKKLIGKKIAILATYGVEQVELTSPRKALIKEGAIVHVISPHKAIGTEFSRTPSLCCFW
jgi:putative intracellular protease/amidase